MAFATTHGSDREFDPQVHVMKPSDRPRGPELTLITDMFGTTTLFLTWEELNQLRDVIVDALAAHNARPLVDQVPGQLSIDA